MLFEKEIIKHTCFFWYKNSKIVLTSMEVYFSHFVTLTNDQTNHFFSVEVMIKFYAKFILGWEGGERE